MPSKYPVLSPEKVISVLERYYGFRQVSQKGSHRKLTNGTETVIIPMHRELAKGTLRGVLNMANISLEDFVQHIE